MKRCDFILLKVTKRMLNQDFFLVGTRGRTYMWPKDLRSLMLGGSEVMAFCGANLEGGHVWFKGIFFFVNVQPSQLWPLARITQWGYHIPFYIPIPKLVPKNQRKIGELNTGTWRRRLEVGSGGLAYKFLKFGKFQRSGASLNRFTPRDLFVVVRTGEWIFHTCLVILSVDQIPQEVRRLDCQKYY